MQKKEAEKQANLEIETHPFEPWLPKNARLLMLGTFPPAPKRWFSYLFFGDKMHFVDQEHKTFNVEAIKALLKEKGVAIFDTALRIRRTKNNASDKDLEIVEPSDLDNMLRSLPACKSILAAGQLATEVFTKHYGIKTIPKMGQYTEFTFEGRTLRLYRMPSSSRAYPMQIEKKAEFYRKMFEEL